MVRLSEADYMATLDAVHEVAGVANPDEFAPVVLRHLAGLIRSDVTGVNEVDPASGRVVYVVEPASFEFPPGSAELLGSLASQHPLIRHHTDTGDGSAVKISDLLAPAAWHDTEIYRRFYAPLGVEHQMSITLPAPLPIIVGIALNRAEGDFGERDRAVLNLLRPHLAQSWRRAREYERLETMLRAAGTVLARSGSGVIVLSEPPQEITGGSWVSLYRFFGRPAPRDPLPGRVRRWLDWQRSQAHGADAGIELARPLRATLDGRQLVLRYLPGVRGREDVILLDERPSGAPTATLRGVGLTEREAVVLHLVSSGATNAEIARQLSLSTWTVKRHLGNVYAKLGVSSRVQVAALALEIDAHHRLPGDPAP